MSKFKIGDRVMVYGWVQMHHDPYKPRRGGKATIAYYPGSEHPHAQFDDDSDTSQTNNLDISIIFASYLINADARRSYQESHL